MSFESDRRHNTEDPNYVAEWNRMYVAGMPSAGYFNGLEKPPTAEERLEFFRDESARLVDAADTLQQGQITREELIEIGRKLGFKAVLQLSEQGIDTRSENPSVRVFLKDVFTEIGEQRDRELVDSDLPWILRMCELASQNLGLAEEAMEKIKMMRDRGINPDPKHKSKYRF